MSGNNDTEDHCWVKQSLAGVNRQLCPAQRDSLLSVRFRFVFLCVASGIHDSYELGDVNVRWKALKTYFC